MTQWWRVGESVPVAIQEPETRKRYTIQPPPSMRGGAPPRKRRFAPAPHHGPAALVRRIQAKLRERREAKILDALATDAIREYRAGRTKSGRDYARERGISLDDQR